MSNDLDLGSTIRGFSPEQKVFNRFTLKKILGRGGMGVVWLAQDEHLEQKVALKFLPEVIMSDRTALEDLKKETRRSREMTHPHIVRIHDFVFNDQTQTAAISMEFIEGDTLSNRRTDRPNKIFSVSELRPWVEQMCSALHYAHTKAKVVHRDLKPANLMLDGQGEIKITDFGIARSISDSVSRVSMATSSGTPVYMSPQQMMGDQPGPTDDVYALGATIYELLTSRPPFHSGNVILQVKEKAPPSMTVRRAELEVSGEPIPEVWETVVAACLAKDASARPASMAEVAKTLGLGGHFAIATAPSPLPIPLAEHVPTNPPMSRPTNSTKPVATPPPPKPVVPREPRKPMPRWVLPGVGGLVVVALLIVAAVIGPEKWRLRRVGEASRRSQNAANVQDWLTALISAREAMDILKDANKDNSEYSRRYNEVQQGCLESLARAGSGENQFSLWANLSPQIKDNLTEKYARQFDDLRANVSAAYAREIGAAGGRARAFAKAGREADAEAEFTRLRPFRSLAPLEFDNSEAAVKSELTRLAAEAALHRTMLEINAALELAANGDTTGALAKLNNLAKNGIATAEIETARQKVQTLAEMASVEQLARAMLTEDQAAVQAALNDYAKVTGKPVDVTAAALLAEKDFKKFLSVLEQLRMRPAQGAPRTNHFDLLIVDALKARLTPADDAAQFLSTSYSEWAGEELGRQRPGSALLLSQLAKSAGGSTSKGGGMDARKITESLAQKVNLTLAVPLTTTPAGLPAGLQSAGRDVLSEKLQAVMGSFIRVVAKADPKNPGTMVASTRLSPLETKDNPRTEQKSETVQEGEKRVPSAARKSLLGQLTISEAALPHLSRHGGRLGFLPVPSPYEAMAANIGQLRNRLQYTPEYDVTPNMVNRTYEQITHNLNFSTDFIVELFHGERAFGQPLAVKISQTREMVQRSTEATKPNSAMSSEAFATTLRQNLEREFAQSGNAMIKAIADESLVTVESQHAAGEATDLRWGLLQLWKNAGVTLADPLKTERALRFDLGLGMRP